MRTRAIIGNKRIPITCGTSSWWIIRSTRSTKRRWRRRWGRCDRWRNSGVHSGLERYRFAGVDGLLSAEAHGDGPAAVFASGGQWRAVANGGGNGVDLVNEFEDFAGDFCDGHVADVFSIEMFEGKGWVERGVHRAG